MLHQRKKTLQLHDNHQERVCTSAVETFLLLHGIFNDQMIKDVLSRLLSFPTSNICIFTLCIVFCLLRLLAPKHGIAQLKLTHFTWSTIQNARHSRQRDISLPWPSLGCSFHPFELPNSELFSLHNAAANAEKTKKQHHWKWIAQKYCISNTSAHTWLSVSAMFWAD